MGGSTYRVVDSFLEGGLAGEGILNGRDGGR